MDNVGIIIFGIFCLLLLIVAIILDIETNITDYKILYYEIKDKIENYMKRGK